MSRGHRDVNAITEAIERGARMTGRKHVEREISPFNPVNILKWTAIAVIAVVVFSSLFK